MAEVKDPINDTTSSEDMLKLDLGRNITDIYDTLDGVKIDSDDPGILDPEFYRRKLGEVRSSLTTIQQTYSKVMRAKTSAQTRLTSRETRFEILMNSSLENNAEVMEALSADERKARAANRLVELKNAIRESKNEVEALKNVEKVLSVYSKSLSTISADIKQQSRMVELELQRLPKVVGGDNDKALTATQASDMFNQSIKAIEEKYSMTPVEASEAEVEDDVEADTLEIEEEAIGDMTTAFASANLEFGLSAETPAPAIIPPTDEVKWEVPEEKPTLDIPEEKVELEVPSEGKAELDLPIEGSSELALPGEAEEGPAELDFDMGESESSPEVVSSPKVVEPTAQEVDEDATVMLMEDSVLEDDLLTIPGTSDDSVGLSEINENLGGLDLGGISTDFSGETTKVGPTPSTVPNGAAREILPESFDVVSAKETPAKVSKEFAEAPKETVTKATPIEPAQKGPSQPATEATAEPSMDDLLLELLGG
jgi:hypothetical protein